MTDNTEQKDAFEGVRAEFHAESVDYPIWLILNAGEENEVSIECESVTVKREKLLTIVEQFAIRWNNQATLKSEMNELADKILAMEKPHEEVLKLTEGLKTIGDKTLYVYELATRWNAYHEQQAEITRLKEENEKLKGELQCFEGEKELYEESNEDIQSQLSQAKERIEELETPDFIYDPEDSSNYYKYGSGEMEECIEDYGIDWIGQVLKMHTLVKGPDKYAVNDGALVRIFDTEEQAQAALKEGE